MRCLPQPLIQALLMEAMATRKDPKRVPIFVIREADCTRAVLLGFRCGTAELLSWYSREAVPDAREPRCDLRQVLALS
eukprot:scaffold362_cov246-Pinguiococcus_pyrenoidosus.AAC.4